MNKVLDKKIRKKYEISDNISNTRAKLYVFLTRTTKFSELQSQLAWYE